MDLDSLENNLMAGKYKEYSAFFADLQLIWDNCKQYNIAESVSLSFWGYL